MKKLLLALLGIFALISCSVNQTTEAQFEFDGAIYRITKYDKGTPKQELIDHVSITSNSEKTTYYFYYPKETDLSVFTTESFNKGDFYQTVIESKPDYGFYKMPTDDKVFDDAVWVLEQAQK